MARFLSRVQVVRLPAPHEIRDPIHGLIHLTDQELAIVSTPIFQRLRRIRQLAMAVGQAGARCSRYVQQVRTIL
jgi:HD superfamily phosphohydrolase